MQESGLQVAYANSDDRDLKDGVHMLLSLAFVPVEDVEAAFDGLQDDLVEELDAVTDYFEEYYIKGRCPRARRARAARPPAVRPR